MQPSEYPVFASLREVLRKAFANRQLVVERFIPEFDWESYAIRYCYSLGQAGACYLLRSYTPATKFSNAHRIERVPVPESIEAFRRRQGLDYGKIDFVMRAGHPVVLDVNRTPALRPDAQALASEIIAVLAPGLQSSAADRSAAARNPLPRSIPAAQISVAAHEDARATAAGQPNPRPEGPVHIDPRPPSPRHRPINGRKTDRTPTNRNT